MIVGFQLLRDRAHFIKKICQLSASIEAVMLAGLLWFEAAVPAVKILGKLEEWPRAGFGYT